MEGPVDLDHKFDTAAASDTDVDTEQTVADHVLRDTAVSQAAYDLSVKGAVGGQPGTGLLSHHDSCHAVVLASITSSCMPEVETASTCSLHASRHALRALGDMDALVAPSSSSQVIAPHQASW